MGKSIYIRSETGIVSDFRQEMGVVDLRVYTVLKIISSQVRAFLFINRNKLCVGLEGLTNFHTQFKLVLDYTCFLSFFFLVRVRFCNDSSKFFWDFIFRTGIKFRRNLYIQM